MRTVKHPLKLSALFFLACTLSDCSSDSDIPGPPARANLENFFESLPEWEVFSPPLASAENALADPVVDIEGTEIDGEPYLCSSTSYSLTETPDKITTLNPDVEILYVGSLLQGDGYLHGIGSLAELPVRQRAPIAVTLDLLTGDNSRVVERPDVSSVNQAIGALINEAQKAGHKAGSNIFFKSQTTHSITQASLKMGLSASYMGASIKASLSSNLSTDKRTVTAYFVQQMFTASMVLPQYPEDLFSDEFTQDLLSREMASGRMSPGNPPVYVSSIVYGRILMFSFTSSSTEAKIKATLSAVYNSGEFGGELDSELQKVLSEAEITVVTVGGDADQALGLIRENRLAAFFSTDSPLSTAKPISYTIRNLKDNAVARVSETTMYELNECNPAAPTGAEYTIKLTRIEAVALPDIDPITDLPWNTAEVYYSFKLEDLAGPRIAANRDFLLNGFLQLVEGSSADLVHFPPGKILKSDMPVFNELPLHLDGRDYIRIHGILWDNDDALGVTDDEFRFNREFRGANGLPFADNVTRQFSITHRDASGNEFKLYGTYQRTNLLFD